MKRSSLNFSRPGKADEVEINLIPFIDVLLVILIFLMLSTSFTRLTQLQIQLPVADAPSNVDRPRDILLAVSSDGQYAINRDRLQGRDVAALTDALRAAASGSSEATLVISADALATHQSVIQVMDAARRAGLVRIVFTAQKVGP